MNDVPKSADLSRDDSHSEELERLRREVERLREPDTGLLLRLSDAVNRAETLEEVYGVVRVTVSDSGPGISAEHLDRIFERYYQAPSGERSGVGLGLFISRGIVTAHGGRIWAESTPGAGSRFSFTLPLYAGDAR